MLKKIFITVILMVDQHQLVLTLAMVKNYISVIQKIKYMHSQGMNNIAVTN